MGPVLLKANLVNLSTGQYWLNFHGEKGCRTVKVMATRPYYIRATFPPLRHSVHQLLERHHCIHRLINHVYTKGPNNLCYSLPHDSHQRVSSYWLRVKEGRRRQDACPLWPQISSFSCSFREKLAK